MTKLGHFLKSHRISQAMLATALDVSPAQACRLVHGDRTPNVDTVNAILEFCRAHEPAVTYEELFGGTVEVERLAS